MSTDRQPFQNAQTAGEAAALWWAAALRNPTHDNGDNSSVMGALIRISKRTFPPQPTKELEQFVTLLSERLNELLNSNNPTGCCYTPGLGIRLSVGYHPLDALLSDCADQAGLRNDTTSWPWNTLMWVNSHEITLGYNREEIIWTKQS